MKECKTALVQCIQKCPFNNSAACATIHLGEHVWFSHLLFVIFFSLFCFLLFFLFFQYFFRESSIRNVPQNEWKGCGVLCACHKLVVLGWCVEEHRVALGGIGASTLSNHASSVEFSLWSALEFKPRRWWDWFQRVFIHRYTVKTVKEYKIHYDSSLSSANSSQFHTTIKPHAIQSSLNIIQQ